LSCYLNDDPVEQTWREFRALQTTRVKLKARSKINELKATKKAVI